MLHSELQLVLRLRLRSVLLVIRRILILLTAARAALAIEATDLSRNTSKNPETTATLKTETADLAHAQSSLASRDLRKRRRHHQYASASEATSLATTSATTNDKTATTLLLTADTIAKSSTAGNASTAVRGILTFDLSCEATASIMASTSVTTATTSTATADQQNA